MSLTVHKSTPICNSSLNHRLEFCRTVNTLNESVKSVNLASIYHVPPRTNDQYIYCAQYLRERAVVRFSLGPADRAMIRYKSLINGQIKPIQKGCVFNAYRRTSR